MTPSWSKKLQPRFFPQHLATRLPKEVARRTLSTCKLYLTTYMCGLFTASTTPNNFFTFLWNGKVYQVSPDPILSAKGRQCQTILTYMYARFLIARVYTLANRYRYNFTMQ